jgi:hypothetical protein
MAEAVKAVEMVVVTAVETAVGMAAEARAEAVNVDVVPVVGKARVEREARLVAAARMSRSF